MEYCACVCKEVLRVVVVVVGLCVNRGVKVVGKVVGVGLCVTRC